MDPYFSIDIPAIGVDCAHLFPELFRKHLSTDSVNHCIDHSPGFRSQLLIGGQEQLIFLGIDLALSTLGQTLGIGLCLLHLAPQVLPLCFQIRDGPLMDTQLVGKWEKFFEERVSRLAAGCSDVVDILQNGGEVAAGVK